MTEITDEMVETAHRVYETFGHQGGLKTRRVSDACMRAVLEAVLPMVKEQHARIADHTYHQISNAEAEYATADRSGRAVGMLVAMKIATDIRTHRKLETDT